MTLFSSIIFLFTFDSILIKLNFSTLEIVRDLPYTDVDNTGVSTYFFGKKGFLAYLKKNCTKFYIQFLAFFRIFNVLNIFKYLNNYTKLNTHFHS